MSEQVQKHLDEIGVAFQEFKRLNDKRLEEIEASGKATSETLESLVKVEADMDEMQNRVGEIEADMKARSLETRIDNDRTKESVAHMQAFEAWCRRPKDGARIAALEQAAAEADQSAARSHHHDYRRRQRHPDGSGGAVAAEDL